MLSFSLSAAAYNKLVRRFQSLLALEKGACIHFVPAVDKIEAYFYLRLDKTQIFGLFHETIPVENMSGKDTVSASIYDFASLKVVEADSSKKNTGVYSDIKFSFSSNTWKAQYTINWGNGAQPNKINLNFGAHSQEYDPKKFEKISIAGGNQVKFDAISLSEAISVCNFIKSDATSKDTNGSLFYGSGQAFSFINTDSVIAVKYDGIIVENSAGKAFKAVLSYPVLSAIRAFIAEETDCFLSFEKSYIGCSVAGREMVLPIMARDYLIDDPDTLFSSINTKVALLELKPLLSVLEPIISKSADLYKITRLAFKAPTLEVKTQVDVAENVPATVISDADIAVNGDCLLTTMKKILPVDDIVELYFSSSSDHLLMVGERGFIKFLIQGLTV